MVIISTQHKVDEQQNDDPHILPFYLTGASWTQKDYAEHYRYELYGDEDNVFVSVSSNRAKRKKNTHNAASIEISNRFEALQFSIPTENLVSDKSHQTRSAKKPKKKKGQTNLENPQ